LEVIIRQMVSLDAALSENNFIANDVGG